MARKHKPEDIIGKLCEQEIVLAQGGTIGDACRRIGFTEQSYYCWRKEYGGLKMDQAGQMKDLEKEDIARSVASVAKAQSILGWKATHSLDDICQSSWNWQSKNPQGYRGSPS